MCGRLHLLLYTPRLLLRDFILADFQAIHAYASDPEVTQFMFYGRRDEADTAAYPKRERGLMTHACFNATCAAAVLLAVWVGAAVPQVPLDRTVLPIAEPTYPRTRRHAQ
jgi:hypothetical protein